MRPGKGEFEDLRLAAKAAAKALDEAATLDPADGLAVELFATLSAWAPEVVSPEQAACAGRSTVAGMALRISSSA